MGRLYLVASRKGLEAIHWKKQAIPFERTPVLVEAARQLREFLGGQRRRFDLPLRPTGTSFQRRVWRALRSIPYGRTVSYAELAKKIKHPKAARAIGAANGANPLCVVLPCHRVIASDGSIGGYSGGLHRKRKLLAMEGIRIPG